MRFPTELTITGPFRSPAQMLAHQTRGGAATVHDADAAASLGLAGAPIEGPTHFSQLDPLAVARWGQDWFERGCISCHFQTMVVEGESLQASMTTGGGPVARVHAAKEDGTPVLVGTASIGPEYGPTELDVRRVGMRAPDDLFIVDLLEVGMTSDGGVAAVPFDESNGPLYPFSLAEKLERITEPHPWYAPDTGSASPWGRPVLPFEMISVLAHKNDNDLPIRQPSVGLFLDLEVRVLDGPVLAETDYRVQHEVVGLSASRRTESCWIRTSLTEVDSGRQVAEVLLHRGVFKDSYRRPDGSG